MTTYSDLRRTFDKAMREAEEAYVRMRDEDGASDEALTAGRRCQDTLTTAWRLAGILADDH